MVSRDEIVDIASDILDHQGAAALSMRAIAARLQIKAASLYHHVPGKAVVLQAIVDRVTVDVTDRIDPAAPWRELLSAMADSLRETLRAHPGATTVIATMPASPDVAAAIAERFGPALARQFGSSVDEALLIVQSLYVLVIGLALAEFGDVPNPPTAPKAFYDSWFTLATTIYLDGIAARQGTRGDL